MVVKIKEKLVTCCQKKQDYKVKDDSKICGKVSFPLFYMSEVITTKKNIVKD